MYTHIYFVRHAHSVYSADELSRPLSAEGLTDTETATGILRNEKIDIVISSPYKRAVQTVQGIADFIGKAIVEEADFRERLLSAEPVADFQSAITKVWENPAVSLEGGESNIAAQKRAIAALFNVLKAHKGKNIAIGTHGNIMVLMMNYFDEKYGVEFWKGLDMPDMYKLSFENNVLKEVSRLWKRRPL